MGNEENDKRERTDREIINIFLKRVELFRKMRVVQDNDLDKALTVNWERGTFPQLKLPSDIEYFIAFLTIFRPFISSKDDCYINKTYNIGERHIADDKAKKLLRQSRKHWNKALKEGDTIVNINNKRTTPKDLCNYFFYHLIFHDIRKHDLLDRIDIQTEQVLRRVFYQFLWLATEQIFEAERIIREAMEKGLLKFNED